MGLYREPKNNLCRNRYWFKLSIDHHIYSRLWAKIRTAIDLGDGCMMDKIVLITNFDCKPPISDIGRLRKVIVFLMRRKALLLDTELKKTKRNRGGVDESFEHITIFPCTEYVVPVSVFKYWHWFVGFWDPTTEPVRSLVITEDLLVRILVIRVEIHINISSIMSKSYVCT